MVSDNLVLVLVFAGLMLSLLLSWYTLFPQLPRSSQSSCLQDFVENFFRVFISRLELTRPFLQSGRVTETKCEIQQWKSDLSRFSFRYSFLDANSSIFAETRCDSIQTCLSGLYSWILNAIGTWRSVLNLNTIYAPQLLLPFTLLVRQNSFLSVNPRYIVMNYF